MRQNLTIVLLSVIATLLLVIVVQNVQSGTPILAQTGGGATATVGPIGIATGTVQGADAAGLWIYLPDANKLLLYDYGSKQLRLRAVRDISFDIQATDFNLPGNKGPTVSEVKASVTKK